MIAPVSVLFLVGLTSVLAQYKTPVYYQPRVAYTSGPAYVSPAPAYVAPRVIAPAVVKSTNPEAGAAVVAEYRDVSFDGNFNYGFDSSNGLSVKSKGYLKPPVSANEPPVQAIEGSYSYVDQYGKPQTINYVADENGYRAYGDSIPQPPAPVPGAAPAS